MSEWPALQSSSETSFFSDEERKERRQLEQQSPTDASELAAWDKLLGRQDKSEKK